MKQKLSKEKALELHRAMWGDMQIALGDNPTVSQRDEFKHEWCRKHFPNEEIVNHCFLCEYVFRSGKRLCLYCPIDWGKSIYGDGCITGRVRYEDSPISEILSLPERDIDG